MVLDKNTEIQARQKNKIGLDEILTTFSADFVVRCIMKVGTKNNLNLNIITMLLLSFLDCSESERKIIGVDIADF